MSKFGFLRNISNGFRDTLFDLVEWYTYATLKQQHMVMIASGACLGAIVGVTKRRRRIKDGEFSTNFEFAAYNVHDVEEFEQNWNEQARIAQKQPGYKFTRLYKAYHWDRSPTHYLQLRLWRSKEDLENYKNLAQQKVLEKRVNGAASETQFGLPVTIVDDSVRRGIDF
ncbi:hypothetical protein BEWA_024310 [Theileria equi strain WA]|uniref:ABM domain-containing protein n=1 Tax=Theileria equi strain WA TaxID=1537102 RepID=L0AVE6_THEEQ|nr:hypothetical protein BEWA_024310 [Theileria equi strain WA]AFZ79582.1 hypothetical protein BEWA_024310 [Theileria equi strain WA]|eukprot:XP_004829248.1 hypothetical protein BEWA_024310 [Theileria equi strain WA]